MKAQLQYFRPFGKWYADAELEVDGELPLFKIWEQIGALREAGTLPGLVEGHSEYIVYVDVPEHRHAHPVLLGVRQCVGV